MTHCSLRRASTCHAVIAVFLQFFSWGLITAPMIRILNTTFQDQALILNGVIMGVKGLLSFLSAPLIGSLSDVWGRKMFLFITAFFTCIPIPFLLVDATVYFVALSLSGMFSIIFSVAFAYVSDVTDESGRSLGYGLVTAGFAASLIISPALGAGIELLTGSETWVIITASLVALADVVFIIFFVPESLNTSSKLKLKSLTLKQVDPFSSLQFIWKDRTILVISLVTFLSYLPEAGQSTCFFVYLTLVLGISKMNVAIFICYVGVISALSQTVILSNLIKRIGPKYSIMIGLCAQLAQLICYGVSTDDVAVWTAGIGIAMSSIVYAAISAYASIITDKDKQGAVQGTLMGVRGLCNGFGPAAFGLMWHLFGIDITKVEIDSVEQASNTTTVYLGSENMDIESEDQEFSTEIIDLENVESTLISEMPGLPFLVISGCVVLALICSVFLENISVSNFESETKSKTANNNDEESQASSNNSEEPLAVETEEKKSNNNANETVVI